MTRGMTPGVGAGTPGFVLRVGSRGSRESLGLSGRGVVMKRANPERMSEDAQEDRSNDTRSRSVRHRVLTADSVCLDEKIKANTRRNCQCARSQRTRARAGEQRPQDGCLSFPASGISRIGILNVEVAEFSSGGERERARRFGSTWRTGPRLSDQREGLSAADGIFTVPRDRGWRPEGINGTAA